MRTKGYVAIGVVVLCVLVLCPASRGQLQADAPWPMFRHDATHTGVSPHSGPAVLVLSWSYRTDGDIYLSPAIGDGRVYIGGGPNAVDEDPNVYTLSPDGALVWSYSTGDWVGSSPAIAADGRIFVGSRNGRMFSFGSGGSLSWSYTAGDWVRSSPAIGDDGDVYFGSSPDRIYRTTSDGSLVWSYRAGNSVRSSPAIGDGGRVFAGSTDDRLYAIGSAGTLEWSYRTGGQVTASPAIASDGSIYISPDSNADGNIYALGSTGSFLWSYRIGIWQGSSAAVGSDGAIYVGSGAGFAIYSLNSNGSLRWSYQTNYANVNSSPVIDSDGNVYVGVTDGIIYALRSNGGLSWSYASGDYVNSSPSIGGDGRLYIGSHDNVFYCLGPTPTPTPLPNYVNLSASPSEVSPGGTETMSWSCDFSRWDYRGAPADVYIAAIRDPRTADGPSSTADALGGGEVYLWGKDMATIYRYEGSVGAPAYANVAFPPAPLSGSKAIAVPANTALAGDWVFATAFIRRDTGAYVRADGRPVENSALFRIRQP